MRASSMFLVRFSSFAVLKMDASIISRNTLLCSVRPLLTSQRRYYIPYSNISRRRNPQQLCRYSSEPPLPLLQPKAVPLEQGAEGKVVKVDCATESTTEVAKDVCATELDFKPANVEMEMELETNPGESVIEVAREEFNRVSSVDVPFKNVEPSSPGRQRKRRASVVQASKRLYSEEEDLGFMQEALVEAKKAVKLGEVPVGAVLVHKNNIIARFHNQVETTNDPTAHAEMLCIRGSAAQLGGWRLTDVTMYVTLEPCPMCAGAILQGRLSELVWGAPNSLLGADGSWIKLFPVSSTSEHEPKGKDYLHPFHRTITVRRGVLAEESADLMQTFFATRRLQPKCRTDDANMSVKSAPWPRSPGWFPPTFKKLNSWVNRWFQF